MGLEGACACSAAAGSVAPARLCDRGHGRRGRVYEERKRLNEHVLCGLEPALFQPSTDAEATATAREMVRVRVTPPLLLSVV